MAPAAGTSEPASRGGVLYFRIRMLQAQIHGRWASRREGSRISKYLRTYARFGLKIVVVYGVILDPTLCPCTYLLGLISGRIQPHPPTAAVMHL